jgi:hypothetical protein
MRGMLIIILQHTPGWVWLMLAGLLALGLWQRLHLPGSWLPMALIVLIFAPRYAAGVAQGLHPEWRALWPLQAGQALLFGALSGLFAGRALALRRLAGHTMRAHA